VTVRRGEPWGEPGPLAGDGVIARSDGEAADALAAAMAAGAPFPEVGLLGGDLHRSLGAPDHDEGDLRAGRGLRVPMDVGEVLVERPDGVVSHHLFVAHFVAGPRRRWRARTVVAMNATFLGPADLGPRAHPNDGLLDVTDGWLPRKDRRAADKRELTGTHLPHPSLAERRTAAYKVEADADMELWVDGRPIGSSRTFEVRCRPDAFVVVA
jgi:hypothetical protein